MSGSARLRDSPRSGLIAAALCVLATAAVLITAPAVHSALRSGASAASRSPRGWLPSATRN